MDINYGEAAKIVPGISHYTAAWVPVVQMGHGNCGDALNIMAHFAAV